MGTIAAHSIGEIITKFKTEIFFETGTYKGAGVDYALNHSFKEVHSVEFMEEHYLYCASKYARNLRVRLWRGSSHKILQLVGPSLRDERILFWLDAHLPAVHKDQDQSIKTNHSDELQLPLESELRALAQTRDLSKDVFVIDDLRIYETGPFENGNWGPREIFENTHDISFIEEIFAKTHHIERDFRHEGYLIISPK
jgi:hypothetical protein